MKINRVRANLKNYRGVILRIKCLVISGLMSITACSSTPEATDSSASLPSGQYTFDHDLTEKDYRRIIEKYSDHREHYDGFTAKFVYDAILLNTEVLEAQLWQQATDFKWTPTTLQQERQKMNEKTGQETVVFISFFAPESENDNLESARSIWKVFLVQDQARYEGKVVRTGGNLVELQRRYPFHTRFNTPYEVTFRVPVVQIQQAPSRLQITGPLGSSEITFPPAGQQ